jgi:hypothetical protein
MCFSQGQSAAFAGIGLVTAARLYVRGRPAKYVMLPAYLAAMEVRALPTHTTWDNHKGQLARDTVEFANHGALQGRGVLFSTMLAAEVCALRLSTQSSAAAVQPAAQPVLLQLSTVCDKTGF